MCLSLSMKIKERRIKKKKVQRRRQWHFVLPKIKCRLKRNGDNPQTVCCLCSETFFKNRKGKRGI